MISKLRIYLVTYILGPLLCMNPVTAIIALGWIYRSMHRHALIYWSKQAAQDTPKPAVPHWVCGMQAAADSASRLRRFRHKFFGGLGVNVKRGLEALFTVGVLTLPISAIWMIMWWAGWIVSFHKSYEESYVPIVTSVSSVLLFALVMLYLPMAQARHAVTGEWRRFFDVRLIRILTRYARVKLMLLTLLYCLGAAGVLFGKDAVRLFVENIVGFDSRDLDALKDAYIPIYVMTVFVLFAGLTVLRGFHARIYASAVLKAVKAGAVHADDLAENEKEYLQQLGLLKKAQVKKAHLLVRSLGWFLARLRTLLAVVAQYMLWLAFAFIVYFGQFLGHDWYEWLIHPLVHQPFIGFYFGDPNAL